MNQTLAVFGAGLAAAVLSVATAEPADPGGADQAVLVFDFEADADLPAWRLSKTSKGALSRSPDFAASGGSSLCVTSPAPLRLEFEGAPSIRDWQAYDRLAFDLTNPNQEHTTLRLAVIQNQDVCRMRETLDVPAYGHRQVVVRLADVFGNRARDRVEALRFTLSGAQRGIRVHIDRVALLPEGVPPPAPSSALMTQLAEMTIGRCEQCLGLLEESRRALEPLCAAPALRRRAASATAALEARIQAVRAAAGKEPATPALLDAWGAALEPLPRACERLQSEFRAQAAWLGLGHPDAGPRVGFATAMEKLLPRDAPFDLTVTNAWGVSLARNEKESFQVAVLAADGALEGVSVRVAGDLASGTGSVFAARQIDCEVMGYVETTNKPQYRVLDRNPYVGWWPDPILNFLGPVDIAAGDVQAFWVRVRAPKAQPPGLYRGAIEVEARGIEPLRFELAVTVRPFTLPDHSPLPTALAFFERKGQMGGEAGWPSMKLRYADFLADYYIGYDSLYRKGPPDYEIVMRLRDRGQLVTFNLGNVFNQGIREADADAAIRETVERLRPAYEWAKEQGLLRHAYIYGFDECPKDQYPMLERCAAALRAAFPEVMLLTSTQDSSYGEASVVKTIDAWCPFVTVFVGPPQEAFAARARAAGKKLWWYICLSPWNPYPNWFVEYAAIEARLLMGAMTAKYRPDGFLYYSLTQWKNRLSSWTPNAPITNGPFTDWDPLSWPPDFHGDGSLICAGPDGGPLPTIRLENYRDGLEDYAYVCLLEEIVRRRQADGASLSGEHRQWLIEAEAALPVPAELVRTLSDYSREPARLYAWRDRLADLIERSGVTDADPWGPAFGVRGAAAP